MTAHLTPPQVAEAFGVSPGKVLTWIRNGELQAFNAATTPAGRPRYKIALADVEAFKLRRSVTPTPKVTRRRTADNGVIEFF